MKTNSLSSIERHTLSIYELIWIDSGDSKIYSRNYARDFGKPFDVATACITHGLENVLT